MDSACITHKQHSTEAYTFLVEEYLENISLEIPCTSDVRYIVGFIQIENIRNVRINRIIRSRILSFCVEGWGL